jgi:hypothetical protein
MSADRVATRSKNTAQRPGLLVPKQTRRSSKEVAACRKAKEDAKKKKQEMEQASINRVAEFEQKQAERDEMEQTPRVQAAGTKPTPLVRTRSYADVTRVSASDVEMEDVSAGTPFEYANVEPGQTTDDGMETAVQDLPPKKKNVRFFFLLYLSTYKIKEGWET